MLNVVLIGLIVRGLGVVHTNFKVRNFSLNLKLNVHIIAFLGFSFFSTFVCLTMRFGRFSFQKFAGVITVADTIGVARILSGVHFFPQKS